MGDGYFISNKWTTTGYTRRRMRDGRVGRGRNLLFGSAKSAAEEEEEEEAHVLTAADFEARKSSNFYQLLAKEENGTASADEQAYLDSWYKADVAALYALALTCDTGGLGGDGTLDPLLGLGYWLD